MATISCPDCSKEVSDSALQCTHCGYQLNKPKRTFIGKVALWIFILFNVLMAVWIWGGISGNVEDMENMSDAEAAGAAIGTGIGGMILFIIWVFGDIILGLFALLTRPK